MRALTCKCKGLSTSYVVQRQRIASIVLLPATRSEPLGSLWGLSTLLNHKSLSKGSHFWRALSYHARGSYQNCHITRGALTKTVTSQGSHQEACTSRGSHQNQNCTSRGALTKPAHLGALTKTANLGARGIFWLTNSQKRPSA